MPLSGIPDGSVYRVQALNNIEESELFGLVNYESQIMTMASGSASIAWGTPQSNSILNIIEPSTTFRRVLNGARYISTNSTLAQVPMPYFALDAFEWVRDPHQVLTNKQLSLLNQNASGYNPFIIRANGTGGLIPEGEWGEGPMTSSYSSIPGSTPMITSETRLFTFRVWFPWPLSTPPTTAPPCPQNFTIDPGSEVNFISGPDYPDGRDCFAVANMMYRAGITSSQNCKIISPSVVEAQGPSSLISNIHTPAALGMAPFIAATFFLSNYATPLNYGTNRNLGIELTSRGYQAAWAAMVDHVSMGTNTTTVQIALPTLRAKITYWRLYLWVALHLWVLALGLLFVYFQSYRDHPWVEDPAMAVFWLDTRAVLTDSEGRRVSDPWQPGTEVREDGMLILDHNEVGQHPVQVRRDGGSHGHRYPNSIPLRHRMPHSGSMILRDKGRESVETLIGTSVPTSVLDSTKDSAE